MSKQNKKHTATILPTYEMDCRLGFPFVWLPEMTPEEEARQVKDAIEASEKWQDNFYWEDGEYPDF